MPSPQAIRIISPKRYSLTVDSFLKRIFLVASQEILEEILIKNMAYGQKSIIGSSEFRRNFLVASQDVLE